jgi:hypothetical protein
VAKPGKAPYHSLTLPHLYIWYISLGIPEAEEEGADTDGDDEQVEEDDQLGVVALATQVGGTLQPGRRHIQAQRHLLHRGLGIYTSFERAKVELTLFRGLEARFSVLGVRDILVRIRLRGSVPLANGSGSEPRSNSSRAGVISRLSGTWYRTRGLGNLHKLREKESRTSLFRGLKACFSVLGIRDILVR